MCQLRCGVRPAPSPDADTRSAAMDIRGGIPRPAVGAGRHRVCVRTRAMTKTPTRAPTRLVPPRRRALRWARRALRRYVGCFLVAGADRKERRMTEYLVTWQIYVEAQTAEEAALSALAAQRNAE